MPIPKREKNEEAQLFMGRCMTSEVMSKEYTDQKQRVAVCTQQSRAEASKGNLSEMVQEELVYSKYKSECNYGPEEPDEEEDTGGEEVDAANLWDNIRKKKEREGKK